MTTGPDEVPPTYPMVRIVITAEYVNESQIAIGIKDETESEEGISRADLLTLLRDATAQVEQSWEE